MKRFWRSILIIVVQLAVVFWISSHLEADAKIPSHWNFKGEVDGYSGKWIGLFLFFGINVFVLLMMIFLPHYSPKYKAAPQKFHTIMPRLTTILILFFTLIHIYTLLIAAGCLPMKMNFILYLLGMMFIFIGNIMPKIPLNFFAGIKVPWTLSSEDNWQKTHKFAGYTFSLAGALMLIIPSVWRNNPDVFSITFYIMLFLTLCPILYSFVLYKKQH